MRLILELRAPVVVITLSMMVVVLAGCSGVSASPREQASEAITQANQTIAEHDRLFSEARDTYGQAREAIEAGRDPEEQARRVGEARGKLEDARVKLRDAREPLQEVQNLDVEPEIKDYAGTVTEAMDAQLRAEDQEIEFYRILEKDPILRDDRDRALDVLSEVEDGYDRAEASYARSGQIADANPELIGG